MNLIFAAISLGFLGSFHCVGMCGPIALSLPIKNHSGFGKLSSILSYNFGRALTYSVLGLLFGLIGESFALFGMQQALSVVLGSIILLSVVIPVHYTNKFQITQPLFRFFNALKTKMTNLFQKRSLSSLFTIGLLNGLLPCGLVYIAIAGAIASGSAVKGAVFMAGFGLGTIPLMMTLSWFVNLINPRFRSGLRFAFPYLVSVMAILMILRGMNLGIPYISPKMEISAKNQINFHKEIKCCHK